MRRPLARLFPPSSGRDSIRVLWLASTAAAALMLILGMDDPATAVATYTYARNDFNNITTAEPPTGDYTYDDHVSGWFRLTEPLGGSGTVRAA